MTQTHEYTLPLADPHALLEVVGGKGASLARLVNAGLPVPDGFHVTTEAYRRFVVANGMQPAILEIVQAVDPAQPATLETASRGIVDRFARATLPREIADAIAKAYAGLPGEEPAVAVRSSATAEDLPDLSFAGQQETYLNIHGRAAVLDAVKRCWASFWTARAIAYRAKAGIDQGAVSLAVVVQLLVPADAAGVLFTANPVNGLRDQAMITATWGLGEAIVGGLVTPDTLTVEKASGRIVSRETADKQVMTVRTAGGTAELPTPEARRRAPVLSDQQAAELNRLGVNIERLFEMPVDVEWALADGRFAILQARPITALPEPELAPPTDWTRPNPRATYLRGSLAEHLPNPTSPLFGTLGLRMANVATAQFGLQFERFLGAASHVESFYEYSTVNGYTYMEAEFGLKKTLSLTRLYLANLGTILRTSTERWRVAHAALASLVADWEARPAASLTPSELLEGARELMLEAGRFYSVIAAGTLQAAVISELVLTSLYNLVKRRGDPEATALLFGFDTGALRAEKSLFDLAEWAKARPALRNYALRTPSGNLAADLRRPEPPAGVPAADWAAWQDRVAKHLRDFRRTAYEFDFATPTPAENPEALLDGVRVYVEGRGTSPYERQRAAVERRERTTREIQRRYMPFPRSWFRRALKWAQESGPRREDNLADMGMAHPAIRQLLGELGRRFVAGGAIEAADDVYWLVEDEVSELALKLERGEPLPAYDERVSARRAARAAQLRATPPAMLPQRPGWTRLMPWAREAGSGTTLKGVGTSAGRVTAPACVLFGPEDFGKMRPGAVLVAVTTNPAWTPLFTLASAVVTDIGGPLSHSSIVAREYGIPAVMATGFGTRRIKTGDVITVDGAAGTVTLSRSDG